MKKLHVPILAVAVLLAGCLDDEVTNPPRDALADLAQCHGTYIDKITPLVCTNELEEVSPGSVEPAREWLCQEVTSSESLKVVLYWNPLEDRHAFSYESDDPGFPVSGIAALSKEEETEYLVWNQGPASGFQILPQVPDGVELTLRWWATSHQSTIPALTEGTWHVNWSTFDNRPVPVRVLETNDGSDYYFPHSTFFGGQYQIPYGFPGSLSISGEDFEIEVENLPLGSVYTGSLTKRSFDTCALPEQM